MAGFGVITEDSVPRKVDVRVICASNGSLRDRLKSGQFRKDLLYRLQVGRIFVPPLRDRRDDLPLLVEAFLAEARAATGKRITSFTSDAMAHIMAHDWPGNVRELRNTIDYVTIHCKNSSACCDDLPLELQELNVRSTHLNQSVMESNDERERILAALEQAGGNRSQAARLLGIGRATLYRRLESYGISTTSSHPRE